jgi:flavorubredoxin
VPDSDGLEERMAKQRTTQRELPRLITPDVLWTGGCMELELGHELVHSHFGAYVVRGSQKTMLIDTGHPIHAHQIDVSLDHFLDERSLDYIFVTHAELPHCGLLPKWMTKYPRACLVGDVRDFRLYYPEFIDRFVEVRAGQSVNLGDRKIVLVPGVWADLTDTMWAFDTGDRILFVADGFSITHHHKPGHCGLTTEEQPKPDVKMLQLLNELALQWIRYTDASRTFDALDTLLAALKPRYIAPAHGAVIDAVQEMLPLVKNAMERASPLVFAEAT